MTRYSDAAMLRGDFAKLIKSPPNSGEWDKAACDNKAEEVAQEVAKQIFAMQQEIDPTKEQLEVFTFSSLGRVKVAGIMPGDSDLVRISGILPENKQPVFMIQHASQLSLTFTKREINENPQEDDDGLQIGFVIFDELKKRKKDRAASKKKPAARKSAARKSTARKSK